MVTSEGPNRTAPPHRTPAGLALALALTLGVPLAVQAAEGLRVVRDPTTGELRGPTAAEAAAFEKAEAQLRGGKSPAPSVEVRHADGSVETKLGEDTRMYSVVREGPNGSLIMDCLPSQQARDFVKASKKTSIGKGHSNASHAHP